MNNTTKQKHVVVGMSGGVDSALSAALLLEQGYQVSGVFIRSWEEDGDCPAGEDAIAAAAVADHLDIELDAIDLVDEYKTKVFAGFLDELNAGRTPNPDIWCNASIKFDAAIKYAFEQVKADYFATGHYARISDNQQLLLKAEDESKDQTYFLYRMPKNLFSKVLFPIGLLTKTEVRKLAKEKNIPNADRSESMGICFIGKRSFKKFISNYIEEKQGDFVTVKGEVVGQHEGAHLFTIGQRHGLGLGGEGEPWYVCDKDIHNNTVTVVRGRDNPELFFSSIEIHDCYWLSDKVQTQWVYTGRYRHRMEPQPCTIAWIKNNVANIEFAKPQWGIATGQACVIYDGITCLGGGTIMATHR